MRINWKRIKSTVLSAGLFFAVMAFVSPMFAAERMTLTWLVICAIGSLVYAGLIQLVLGRMLRESKPRQDEGDNQ